MTDFDEMFGGFRVAPSSTARPEAGVTTADLANAIERADALRAQHRTVICRPECANEIRAAVAAEGLSLWVDVVESALVDEGQVLIAHTPLDENGNPAWWPL